MRQKVLYIITKGDVGGAQKYVSDLAKNLDKSQFEAKIIYGGKDLRWLSNSVRPWALFLNDWLAIWELVKIYKKERPDIIHLNSSKAGILGSLAAKIYKSVRRQASDVNPKVVFTAHGWVFNPTNALSFPARWFYILLHKFAALFQDKIICVSEYDFKLALSYQISPEKKLEMIHNGIDPDIKFLDKETARKEIIKKLPVANNQWLIAKSWVGSIGRLVKEKNYETFVRAAALVPDAYFFIIGAGPKLYDLQQTTYSLQLQKRFFFINPSGGDAQYLKAFDIFAMSSIKEGLPYTLLEAMAAELPIVITETGGMPEVIQNHENGLMVTPKNPQLMSKAIQGLLANANIAKELAKASKKAVSDKFNLKKMALKTSEIYLEELER